MDQKSLKREVKVNILTGFLGSGKTTLISKILKNKEIKSKILFIQNELSSEMGIEKDVLTDSDGKELGNLIEMPNGCLCCTVKDNLVIFLEKAIEKFSDISIIVIEAHGLTDVSQLVQKMWLDKELDSPLQLNSIICMIDSYNFFTNYEENEEILKKQLICADKILVNKIDILNTLNNSEEIKININNFIQKTNPLSKVYETAFAEIDLNIFLEGLNLNLSNYELDSTLLNTNISSGKCCNNNNDVNHIHSHLHFAEKFKIENILINVKSNDYTKDRLDKIIGDILWNESEKLEINIIRFKGVLYQKDKVLYIQGIYDIYEISEVPLKENYDFKSKMRESKILFIGKNLVKHKNFINSKFNN